MTLTPIRRGYATPLTPIKVGYPGQAFNPEPQPQLLQRQVQRQIRAARAGDPEPYVFGDVTVAPMIVAGGKTAGGKLILDLLWSVGEVQAIDAITIGGETFTGTVSHYTGTSGQSADSAMAAVKGGSYDALAGKAHSVIQLSPDDGMDIKARMRGLKLVDPRTSPHTTAYSANPALVIAYLVDNATDLAVGWSSIATAADYCDETVGSASRWGIGLAVQDRQTAHQWIETLLQYANCYAYIDGGTFHLAPDTTGASTHTITNADIVAGTMRMRKRGAGSVPDRVEVSFTKPNGTRGVAETSSTITPGKTTRLHLPGIPSHTMAKRKAIETLDKAALQDLEMEFVGFDSGLGETVGDIGTISHLYGVTSKLMRLVDIEQVGRGRWRKVYREYDPAVYDNSITAEPTYPDTDLDSPFDFPTAPTPALTETLFVEEGGRTLSRLEIDWTGVDWLYASGYRVKVEGAKVIMDVTVPHAGITAHKAVTPPIEQGVTYRADVWVLSNLGQQGDTSGSSTLIAAGKLLKPIAPTTITGYEAGSFVALEWPAGLDVDLAGYRIKRLNDATYVDGSSSDWSAATTVANRVDALSVLLPAQPAGDYWYGVKSLDTLEQESTGTAWTKITITDDGTGSQIQDLWNVHPGSLQFDLDSNGRVDLGDVLDMASSDFTVEFRARMNDLAGAQNFRFIGKRDGFSGTNAGWSIYMSASDEAKCIIGDGTNAADISSGFYPRAGVPVTISVSVDRGSNEMRLYFDGVPSDGNPYDISAVTGSLDNAESCLISDNRDNSDFSLSEVRVWNDVRTAAEVRDNFNRQVDETDASLLAYWRLDEATGSSVTDYSGSGHDASISAPEATSWDENIGVISATVSGMHVYAVSGDARYLVTANNDSWATRFGDTSPVATWGDLAGGSPDERWGGDLSLASSFETAVWDTGAVRQGTWSWGATGVTLLGGTQTNQVLLGDNSSPVSYTTHSGAAVNADGQYMKAKVSEAGGSAGDGLHIRMTIPATFKGSLLTQSGSVNFATDAGSPLAQPVAVAFATAYSTAPRITVTVTGSNPRVAAADTISTTGFDLYLWNLSGTEVYDATVNWIAEGT